MSNSDSRQDGSNLFQGKKLSSAIPSDQLARLREMLLAWPALVNAFGEILQLRVVIDANIVFEQLIWRLSKRRNPAARTGLHEAIDSGTVIAFAPPTLKEQVQEHIVEIADYAKVSVSLVLEEWQQFQSHLHFYEPEPLKQPDPNCVDPEDLPYKLVCEQLGAHAVYSRDAHLQKMNVPVIWVQLDLTVRDYARASTIRLTINLGTTYSVTLGFAAFMGFAKACEACVRALKRLPTSVKVIIAAGVLLAIIHPKLREKMINFFRSIRSQFDDLTPLLGDALGDLLIQSALADETAKNTGTEIRSVLPPKRKLPVIVRARAICLLSKEPLSLQEIETRMRKEGYVSKSRNFRAYLRRVLQRDKRFVEISPGCWTIKAERLAASA